MTEENKIPVDQLSENSETCCSNTSCCGPETPYKRVNAKVGRNDPCPCGSERKFKKCCGQYK